MITLVPTRDRTDLLGKFLQSAIDANTTTQGMVIVDKEDWDRNKGTYQEMPKPVNYFFEITEAKTMGDKVREVFPGLKNYKSVCILNDDHFIVTKDWDKKVQEKITGYNFVSTNDNWRSPQKASGATVWSMGLLNAVGWPIYPPGMIHLFIDDLWEYLGKMTGCWNVDHSVTIEHHHPLTGKTLVDKTFIETYGTNVPQDFHKQAVWQNDEKIFNEVLKDQIEISNKIRSLMGLVSLERK
jgi:hypothetical protein